MASLYTPSGLTPQTFNNIQLGAGAFYIDVDLSHIRVDSEGYANDMTSATFGDMLDAAKAEGKSLGATSGGGTFNAVPVMETLAVDGMTYPVIGSTVMYSWDVSLATTVKEVTARNIKRYLATMEVLPDGISTASTLTPEHYIKNLIWAGALISGELACINLLNVINTAGMAMTINDRGGATIPVSFRAHQSDLLAMQYAPFRLIFIRSSQSFVPGITDAQRIAADRALIEAVAFEIPASHQLTQAAKTEWLQRVINAQIKFTAAEVVFVSGFDYEITLTTPGGAAEAFEITVTEALV